MASIYYVRGILAEWVAQIDVSGQRVDFLPVDQQLDAGHRRQVLRERVAYRPREQAPLGA